MTTAPEPVPVTPYDEVPYASHAFPQTHPDRLATIGRIFGLTPPDITRCRVLELGCAGGGNLLPMACALPGSEFVGVDLSVRQVAEGRAAIEQLRLTNARIEHASIADVDADWGRFDYIICHGVYSWVERPIQDKILRICSEQLTDDGIAYVSYNTYPGWHMRESVRHMMRYHALPFDGPEERVAQARAMLDFLVGAVPAEDSAYGRMLAGELDLLRRCADWYLYHEHLEPTNTPLYFHQFAERAQGCGLQYLGEAEFASMLASRFPAPVAETLERISADVIHLEQYMDFVRNRFFRQTLLCKAAQKPRRALSPALLHGLHLAAAMESYDGADADFKSGKSVTFRVQDRGQVTTQHALSRAAFTLLGERWPLGWPAGELLYACRERASRARALADEATLMQDLFHCLLSGIVEARTWQPPCATHAGARPQAYAWAALEVARSSRVTSALHTSVSLETFSRTLLPMLSGQRDQGALLDALSARVLNGSLSLPNLVVEKAAALRPTLAAALDQSLHSLARHGLLSA